MTAPIQIGFPDYGRQLSESQVVEVYDIGVTGNGIVQYPVRPVHLAKTLGVIFRPLSMPLNLAVNFYADAAGLKLLDSYGIDCDNATKARQPVPVLGPYVGFTVAPSGAGNYQYTLQVWHQPSFGFFSGSSIEAAVFSNDGAPIAASTTLQLIGAHVQEGPVTWYAHMSGGNFVFKVFCKDSGGTRTLLARIDAGMGITQPQQIWVPPMTLNVQIENLMAAPENFDLYMTRKHNL